MKTTLKYLLLAGALLALGGCSREYSATKEANWSRIKECNSLGGIPRLDAYENIVACDFFVRDQIRNRPTAPAEVPKGGDTQ